MGVIRAAGRRVLAGLSLTLALAGPAVAQDELLPLPSWYVGPFVGYAIPDADRNAGGSPAFQLVAGKVLAESVAVEANVFSTKFGADMAGGPDTDLLGYGVDLALGTPDYGYPVFLLGAGMVQHDIGGQSKSETFGNLGLGYYLPFHFGQELWRLEARYNAILTDHPALAGEDMVEDVRVSLGVLFTFGREESQPAREPEPAPAAAPAFADEDSDGVADRDDRCPRTIANANVDDKGCVIPEQLTLGYVDFGSSSASLTADGYALLRSVAAAMKADPKMKLEIGGHADASGDKRDNLRLSTARARAVHDYIVAQGVDHRRMTVKGYGDSQPVNDNSTLELRAYNRRVQFRRLDTP